MAGKSTISITFKIDGDSKEFKELTADADGLKKVIQSTITQSDNLKKSLINWSQGVQAISAITDTIGNVSSALSQFSDRMRGLQSANIMITQLTGKTGDEMLKLRNNVQAVAEHFGADFNEVLQSANNLSKAFGISIDDAMKLVQDGFVSGANANGEFLDTLKEYPRYFKEAGLSAEDFVAITTNAAQQGIFSDKGVDVIKEGNLRIREMTTATADALNNIGISAEQVQADLQAGSITTFDVMQMVAAKLNELPASSAAVGTAIADIFGGPGEDAGLEYIKTLASIQLNMDAVKAATQGTAEQQERQIQAQENIKNGLTSLIDLSAIYTDVRPYVDLTAQIGMAAMGIGSLIKTVKAMNIQQAILKTRIVAVAAAQKMVTIATTTWTAVQKVLNLVLTANPIGLIITAIGLLVTALIQAYNNCEGFRQIVDKVWEGIKPLANAIMNGLAKAFEWLVEKCKEAWEWLKNILGLGGKKVEVAVDVSRPKTKAPKMDLSGGKKDTGRYNYTPTGKKSKGTTDNKPLWTEDAKTLKEITDNIQILNDKLQNANVDEAAMLNQQIESWNKKAEAIKNAGKAVDNTPLWKEDANTLEEIGDNIQILNDQLQTATIDEAALINRQIEAWNEKADAIRNAGKEAEKTAVSTGKALEKGWGGIKSIGSSIEGITDALKGNGNAWQLVTGIVDGFIGLYEGIQTVVGIINLLTGASAAHAATKGVEATAETTEATVRATSAATNATASAAIITANKLEAASWKELAAAKYMAAHASIPFVGFGIGAGFVASMLAVVAAAGVPMLAEGGIASGPTLAMVGEYAGASGNPEVIAPLDKLRGMLKEPAAVDFGRVKFEIKGRTLVGILNKENEIIKRN
jgi:phage-related minor tail protein